MQWFDINSMYVHAIWKDAEGSKPHCVSCTRLPSSSDLQILLQSRFVSFTKPQRIRSVLQVLNKHIVLSRNTDQTKGKKCDGNESLISI